MFAKRALALMAMAIVAVSASAQEEQRELNSMTKPNNKQTCDFENYLWPGPKTIRSADDVVCLALRWRSALIKSWTGGINSKYVLAQYAPDGAVSFKNKPGSGFSTGSQLLPTVSGSLLNDNADRKNYFDNTFLPGQPTPIYVGPFEIRQLSKDVVTIAGNWNYDNGAGASAGSNPKQARVLVVFKRYPKVTVDGVTSRNHWLITEMHSSPRLCNTNAPNYGQCNVYV